MAVIPEKNEVFRSAAELLEGLVAVRLCRFKSCFPHSNVTQTESSTCDTCRWSAVRLVVVGMARAKTINAVLGVRSVGRVYLFCFGDMPDCWLSNEGGSAMVVHAIEAPEARSPER